MQKAIEQGPGVANGMHMMMRQEIDGLTTQYTTAFRKLAAQTEEPTLGNVLATDARLKGRRDTLRRACVLLKQLDDYLASQTAADDSQVGINMARAIIDREKAILGMLIKTQQQSAAAEQRRKESEAEIIKLVNKIRLENHLRPLTHDPRLSAAARDHSRDMENKDFFSHTSPVSGKRRFADRAKNFDTTAMAENIANSPRSAQSVFELT